MPKNVVVQHELHCGLLLWVVWRVRVQWRYKKVFFEIYSDVSYVQIWLDCSIEKEVQTIESAPLIIECQKGSEWRMFRVILIYRIRNLIKELLAEHSCYALVGFQFL